MILYVYLERMVQKIDMSCFEELNIYINLKLLNKTMRKVRMFGALIKTLT